MKKDKRPVGRPKGPTSGWKPLFTQISDASHKILQGKKERGDSICKVIDKLIKGAR